MPIQPYLFFNGRCDEAIAFYGSALGAKVELLMRFDESPQPHQPGMIPPGFEKKVMHVTLSIGDATVMASDGNHAGATTFSGFALSATQKDAAAARHAYDALAAGGSVVMPLARTFWSPCFGMVADRFGVGWMVTVAA